MRKKLIIGIAVQLLIACTLIAVNPVREELFGRYAKEYEFTVNNAYISRYYGSGEDKESDSNLYFEFDANGLKSDFKMISSFGENGAISINTYGENDYGYGNISLDLAIDENTAANYDYLELKYKDGCMIFPDGRKMKVTVKCRIFADSMELIGVYADGKPFGTVTL